MYCNQGHDWKYVDVHHVSSIRIVSINLPYNPIKAEAFMTFC